MFILLMRTLTVSSERLILVMELQEAFARAITRLVFPTPGDPSRRIGRDNCKPLSKCNAFRLVVFE